ncbi:Histidine protein methyltransferase 1-like protein [Frankliniella fusca]|uniref:protein-histidine N-methyltransferase n=1 Tax=Frankliniella fusca TaxID=407009 RepID=A0AAE1LD30_9NEOP|nr:Histidine protein methyltransferase 1-like protein [Frankliniella fusca]
MFKFSFPNPDGGNDDNDEGGHSSHGSSDLNWLPSEKVCVSSSHLNYMLSHQDSVSQIKICSFELQHLTTKSVVKSVLEKSDSDSGIRVAEELHSDLVPAKYEGGLKIWECTEDLLSWLSSAGPNANLEGKYVLDLGCGAGLLGIAALKHGATVVFQDYNREVLDSCTIPNVLLNILDEESERLIENKDECGPHCEFYSGDWSSFPDKLQEQRKTGIKFDYILTSETIYNPYNYNKLIDVFKKCLNTTGTVYLAAKTYYFGVGGSLREFETTLEKDGSLKSEVCWKCPAGVSREILKITFVK